MGKALNAGGNPYHSVHLCDNDVVFIPSVMMLCFSRIARHRNLSVCEHSVHHIENRHASLPLWWCKPRWLRASLDGFRQRRNQQVPPMGGALNAGCNVVRTLGVPGARAASGGGAAGAEGGSDDRTLGVPGARAAGGGGAAGADVASAPGHGSRCVASQTSFATWSRKLSPDVGAHTV